ncbi:MAG: beta-ketoacyl-[acyl-carrier-protein] synthase family protein [Chitinophagaceae bacterium]|nr:beta-ketoacyl-[acyl-carrier-protein] synthase family protein [Chitinophagaceae bacterium]
MSKAYIVNTGIITAIGDNTVECFAALKQKRTGVGKAEYLQTFWKDELPVAEVKKSNDELAKLTGVDISWPRTALLSAVAVQEAVAPFAEQLKNFRVGFFSANTVGGMDLTENVYKSFTDNAADVDFRNIANHECGAITELVADRFGISDFVTTISTACSSSANSIMMAAQMIENGMLDVAVAGGADSMSKFTLNGFNTLMILDKQPCQPFDNNRRGLNLGEGAGYVLLMNEEAMSRCNAKGICTVSGYANANDAYHQTASSPEGTGNKLAMSNALKQAGLQPSDIDYINLHGTGTENNDSSEGKAVQVIFAGAIPKSSSTKGYTGHTLGAAGGVEAVFGTLSIANGIVFPNLRWQTQMEDINWSVVTELEEGLEIKHVLSNSFGFGGNCSTLVLSKC